MLELGLQRISRLVAATELPWRAIHVAGTNGKGSVCAYASSMLQASGIRCGRFTSPHLLDRWDCITINNRVISKHLFHEIEDEIKCKDRRLGLEATEFELLTATAFRAFSREQVEVGVVEVGLGGRLDATNVLHKPLATVITRIGMDHESLLGDTIEKIAVEKAGIMKAGVPCFADAANEPAVRQVLRQQAELHAAMSLDFVDVDGNGQQALRKHLPLEAVARPQLTGIALASEAVKATLAQLGRGYNLEKMAESVRKTCWPGRLQWLDLSDLIPRKAGILLDGAHNPQAAKVLAEHVNSTLRRPHDGSASAVTWILAASQGKKVTETFGELVQDYDKVITVEFGPVDGMPWVQPTDRDVLCTQVREIAAQRRLRDVQVASTPDLESALRLASRLADEGPLVVAGSLYLAADLLRFVRAKKGT